jgi:DNA-binding NarL/FixJ family response regulator
MDDRSRPRASIFLVDDHPLVRQGLALLLEQAGFAIGGQADGLQAMLAHPGLASAQVVVLDLTLGPASGLESIPTLCRRGLRVVVYSMHEEAAVVRRALAAGASGYVTKGEPAPSVVEAIRAVLAGANYISPRAANLHR